MKEAQLWTYIHTTSSIHFADRERFGRRERREVPIIPRHAPGDERTDVSSDRRQSSLYSTSSVHTTKLHKQTQKSLDPNFLTYMAARDTHIYSFMYIIIRIRSIRLQYYEENDIYTVRLQGYCRRFSSDRRQYIYTVRLQGGIKIVRSTSILFCTCICISSGGIKMHE